MIYTSKIILKQIYTYKLQIYNRIQNYIIILKIYLHNKV